MKAHSATLTILIARTGPIFSVLLAAIILKEKIYKWHRLSISAFLCIIGVCMMTDSSHNFSQAIIIEPFIWLALMAAILGSLHTILSRDIQVKCDNKIPGSFLAGITLFIGGISIFLWLAMSEQISFELPTHYSSILLFWLGFGTIALPEIISLKAYQMANSLARFSFFDYFRPLFSISWVYLLSGNIQADFYQMLLGFSVISIGILSLNQKILK